MAEPKQNGPVLLQKRSPMYPSTLCVYMCVCHLARVVMHVAMVPSTGVRKSLKAPDALLCTGLLRTPLCVSLDQWWLHATPSNRIQRERRRERERENDGRERREREGREGEKIDHSNVLGLVFLGEKFLSPQKRGEKKNKKRKTDKEKKPPFLFVLTLHGQKPRASVPLISLLGSFILT